MSGSPVYIDGKLVGAISYRIGQFSKEPIRGITPIEEMLEIDAHRPEPEPVPSERQAASQDDKRRPLIGSDMSASDDLAELRIHDAADRSSLRVQRLQRKVRSGNLLLSSRRQDSLPLWESALRANEHQPEPIEPGSAVSAVLVSGDLDIAATCTVTYIDPQRLLACGHPLTQYGMVDMPMTKANVVATLRLALLRVQDR
jgi:hypothetical protein